MSDLIPSIEPTIENPIPDSLKPPVPRDMTDDVRKKDELHKKQLVAEIITKHIESAADIQKAMFQMHRIKIGERTIYRYKKEIREENLKKAEEEGVGKSVEQLAFEIRQSYEMVIKELWIQYHMKDQNGGVRVKALAEIRNTIDKFREVLQSLGLVRQAPTQHQFLDANGNPVDPTTMENRALLNEEFTAFVKAKYQLPVGIVDQPAPATPN